MLPDSIVQYSSTNLKIRYNPLNRPTNLVDEDRRTQEDDTRHTNTSTNRGCKEEGVKAVISSCQLLAQFMDDVVAVAFEDSKKLEFLSAWLRVMTLCVMADTTLGDPQLVSIFKTLLKQSRDQAKTFSLLDLLFCCGEDEHSRIIATLEKTNHLGISPITPNRFSGNSTS